MLHHAIPPGVGTSDAARPLGKWKTEQKQLGLLHTRSTNSGSVRHGDLPQNVDKNVEI